MPASSSCPRWSASSWAWCSEYHGEQSAQPLRIKMVYRAFSFWTLGIDDRYHTRMDNSILVFGIQIQKRNGKIRKEMSFSPYRMFSCVSMKFLYANRFPGTRNDDGVLIGRIDINSASRIYHLYQRAHSRSRRSKNTYENAYKIRRRKSRGADWKNQIIFPMRDVTIYRHEDGQAYVIPWEDRDNPTESEMHPEWAKTIVYTIMPHTWMDMIKSKTKEEVNLILSRYVP